MKNTQSAAATPGRLRRRLNRALLVLGLSVGAIATTATPAQAASAVISCFTPAYGNFLARSIPVQLRAWNGSSWVPILYATLDNNGCAGWSVPAVYHNYYLLAQIEWNNNLFQYRGSSAGYVYASDPSGWVSVPSDGYAYPGNDSRIWVLYGLVNCTGCQLGGH
jgi:hypothetical protein